MTYDLEHVRRLSKRLIDGITSQLDYVIRNGDPQMTYEGIFVLMYIGMLVSVVWYCLHFQTRQLV